MTERADRVRHHPKPGVIYQLTGGSGDRCLSNGDSWSRSVVRCRSCRRPLGNRDILLGHLCATCRGDEAA